MACGEILGFKPFFEALTGYSPMPWQQRLYEQFFSQGKVPSLIDIPTGLGKTSVIAIWLIALANGAKLPRRLVYIVNRRTVVDQATDVAEKLRQRLLQPQDSQWSKHAHAIQALADALRQMAGLDSKLPPLAVSTLRGELADNGAWKINPAHPAIIIGTIDMIGSKLLFSGYGDGRYGRAHHAGLIGHDTLIIHDEAHLTPAFSELLRAVENEQQREAQHCDLKDMHRPLTVLELSATTRNPKSNGSISRASFELDAADHNHPLVRQRLAAVKRLRFAHVDSTEDLTGQIARHALAHEQADQQACRVLVYVRSPETAKKVAELIRRQLGRGQDGRVAVLTGTIRGYERDQLVESSLFHAFKSDRDPPRLDQTRYLVSTSAGEVGIDLDADHMVCDLTTLDSMIQRLGRVNRLGVDKDDQPRDATITVVAGPIEKSDPLREQLHKTVEVLRQLPSANDAYDASSQALKALSQQQDLLSAFAAAPHILPATDILFDAWSLTSIDQQMPGRPEVEAYLHGLTADPPETYVAWRAEVRMLAEAEVEKESLCQWFQACPILAHERLRDRTNRVRDALAKLLKEHRHKNERLDFKLVLLNERGEASLWQLSKLLEKPQGHDPLAYATVVLPIEAGGLNENGMLDPAKIEPRDKLDVAEESSGRAQTAGALRKRERWLYIRDAEGERWTHLLTGQETHEPPVNLRQRERISLKEPPEGEEDEGVVEELVLLAEQREVAADSPEQAPLRESLSDHLNCVSTHAEHIGRALGLPNPLREALVLAARWHDRGKDRPVWQRYANNTNGSEPLAKSEKYGHWRELGGYRHEFGSLLEAAADPDINGHPERDLTLHLIAAHHGWGRPHFEQRAFDNEGPTDPATGQRRRPTTRQNETAAVEAIQGFGRLQHRFGRWGLAWLESLLRCADAMASTAANENKGEAVV
ncbi:type I-G CRISPR-associated helicase/endonuclease Cas3g [Fontivita pretiosa]|uniref:type I-G CRISPR-associated helicase/endonuclease Cas3g n=1 Tax=Fontivita pretiosa TaxID=2989684 RepID=UPI003D186181